VVYLFIKFIRAGIARIKACPEVEEKGVNCSKADQSCIPLERIDFKERVENHGGNENGLI
jgi:hypothetical protein